MSEPLPEAVCDFCGKRMNCARFNAPGVVQCRECFKAMIGETSTPLDLDALAKLEKAACPAEWTFSESYVDNKAICRLGKCASIHYKGGHWTAAQYANGRLIVAARNALPALIEEVRRLRKFNDDGYADWLLKKHRVTELEFENAELRKEIEWRTSESATFRRERDEAREEIAELRKFKDKVRALDRLQQKDWDEPGIELAVQQLEDEIADEVRK